jgi:hypothetical protein
MALDPHTLAAEVGRRLQLDPADTELLEAIDAAADDVLDYSGLDELPDEPRVRRHLVPYAEAIYLAASAPIGTYGALADDTFSALPVPANLHARYAPRFTFLKVSWGVG